MGPSLSTKHHARLCAGHAQISVWQGRPILRRRLRLHAARTGLRLGRLLAPAGGRHGGRSTGTDRILDGEVAHWRLAVQQILDLLTRQRFVLEEPAGDDVQIVDILRQDLARAFEAFVDEPVDLLIDDGLCLLYTSPSPRDGLLSRMP